MNYISASRITTYLQCPQKYKLQYVDKVEWKIFPTSLSLGIAIHSALEAYYSAIRDGISISQDELTDLFRSVWDVETEGKKLDCDDTEAVKGQGESMLKVFFDSIKAGTVLSVEEEFRVPIVDIETGEVLDVDLLGRFDLIELDDNAQSVIIDHKTLGRKPSQFDLDKNLQLSAYAYAYRSMSQHINGQPLSLKINALLKNKTPKLESLYTIRTKQQDRSFFLLVKDVYGAIQSEAFPASPGWQCTGCSVGYKCYMNQERI